MQLGIRRASQIRETIRRSVAFGRYRVVKEISWADDRNTGFVYMRVAVTRDSRPAVGWIMLASDYLIQAFDNLIQFFGRYLTKRFANPLN